MSTKKTFTKEEIQQCKSILRLAYKLEDQNINPECITRMCVFVATCFAFNHQISAKKFTKIIEETWLELLVSVGDDSFEVITDDVNINTWVSDKPIIDDDQ